jgi:hypothetical protein
MKRTVMHALLSLPALLLALSGIALLLEGVLLHEHYLEPWDRTYHQRFADPRARLLAHGILAANGHNMQSWKFVLDRQDPSGLDLWLEPARLVSAVDPRHTQATLSQGTMFEYLAVAGRELGYELILKPFPDGEYSQEARTAELATKRVAHVQLVPAQPRADVLYDELFKPDTSRVAYRKGLLTQEQLALLSEADFPGLRVAYIRGADGERLKAYLTESVRIETDAAAVMQEARGLFRINEREKNAFRYGFSFEGSAMPRFKMHLLQGLLTLLPSLNDVKTARKNFLSQAGVAAECNAGFFLILAEGNSRLHQFDAGRLYSRIQLRAHTLGLAVQPLSQAIEEYAEMGDIRKAIHQDFARENETIMMLFRIGVPETEAAKSMRMDLESLIVS